MARKPPPLISAEVVELMYQQQEAQDGETNSLIDMVIAATVLATREALGYPQPLIVPITVTIDPKSFVPMVQEFQIERRLNDDGTRGVRLHRRNT